MYGHQPTLAASGLTGTGIVFGLSFGWMVLAVFVLAMAVLALITLLPRRRREVRKVNPAAAARMRLSPPG